MDKEQAKILLRSYMPKYLKNKGINIADYFTCLNPEHSSPKCTMSYNPKDYTVHCYDCGCTYDIFSLIGLDFGLSHFVDQFDKAMKIFLPKESISEAKITSAEITDITKGKELKIDYSSYFHECANNGNNTSFFVDRGLSERIVKRFNLGYDSQYKAQSGKIVPHAIIPNGAYSYLAVDASEESDNEENHIGAKHIFNIPSFNLNNDIFITFKEIDTLCLEELGFHAVALVDNANLHELISIIKQQFIQRNYYICLDNKGPDKNILDLLTTEFNNLDIRFYVVDLHFPYENITEIMSREREKLTNRLLNINKLVSIQPRKLPPRKAYIRECEQDDFLNLSLPSGLYGITVNAKLRRLLISTWLFAEAGSMLYFTSNIDWANLGVLVLDYSVKNDLNYYSFYQKIGYSERIGKPKSDAKRLIDIILMQKIKMMKDSTVLLNLSNASDEYIQVFTSKLYREIKDLNLKIIMFFDSSEKTKADNYCLNCFTVEDGRIDDKSECIENLIVKTESLDGIQNQFYIRVIS